MVLVGERGAGGSERRDGGDMELVIERLAVHPRAHRRGQRLTLPGQWDGLVNGETRGRKREALAVQVSAQQVERRSLDIYELLAGGGVQTMIALEQARSPP